MNFIMFGRNLELSFEFFPPRNEREYDSYEKSVKELSDFNAAFVSFTDGAGFSKNREIIRAVEIFRKFSNSEIVAHITSCDKDKTDVDKIINTYLENKIDSFLVVRGDCPRDEFLMDIDDLESTNSEFEYASDLISYLKQSNIEKIGFGTFPTGHPEDDDINQTLSTYKIKVDQGGLFSATQLFFDAQEYLSFRKKIDVLDNNVPTYAGIMPLISYEQAIRFAKICDIKLPKKLEDGFKKCISKDQERSFGIQYITEMCNELIEENVDGLHFYTLNRHKAFKEIYKNLDEKFKK